MGRGSRSITESPGSEFWGLSPEKTRDVETYLTLIEQSVERRKKEGRTGDGHPDRIAEDSPFHGLFEPAFQGNPRWTSRYMWAQSLPAYLDAAKEHGIDLFHLEKPAWLKEAETREPEWLSKSPLDRYRAIETDRATLLVRQWKPELDAIPDGAKCLDVGCGSGFFVRHMQANYPKQVWQATDLERDMPINGSEQDVRKTDWFTPCERDKPLPYSDASMDVITLNNVLHHIPDEKLAGFLGEIERVLKPGGKLLVTEEFAGLQYEASTGRMRPATSDAQVPRQMDDVFWRSDKGSQKPIHQWQTTIQDCGRFKMDLYDNHRVVGTYGTPGLPVMEACMTFTRVGENDPHYIDPRSPYM